MTGYYLLDHPNPNCPDRGDGRYWGYQEMLTAPSWVTVHTAESFADLIGTDLGAENVAAYFTRTDPDHAASYHTLVDSDTTVRCLPAGLDGTSVHTAFHCYQRNTGNLGVSIAMRAAEWATVPDHWATAVLERAATETALWCNLHRIPMVMRSRTEVEAGQRGITGHGIIQPLDRSDPGALFPWERFIELVRAKATGTPINEGDDDVPSLLCDMGGSIFGCFAGIWRPLSGPEYAKWNGKVDKVTHSAAEWKTLQSWGRVA